MKKRILTIVLLIVCCLNLTSIQTLAAKTIVTTDEINYMEAKKIANNFVDLNLLTEDKGNWTKQTEIKDSRIILDENDNITAYLFTFKNNEFSDNGYVIVNSNKNDIPIIEYSTSGECFLDTAIEYVEAKTEKLYNETPNNLTSMIYYFDDMIYYANVHIKDKENVSYDISSIENCENANDNFIQIKKEIKNKKNKKTITRENQENFDEQWDLLDIDSDYTGRTNPSEGSYITNPNNFETVVSTTKLLPGYNLNYFTMSSFYTDHGGNCAPTAATNLLYYYYNLNTAKYGAIRNSTWKKTYDSIHSLMGTTASGGTYDSAISSSYLKYLYNQGYENSRSGLVKGTMSGSKVANAIDANVPVHLALHSHSVYKEHSVLALGYKRYSYTSSTQYYILISDGWINTPTRYVWGGCNGNWNMVTVEPKS